MVDTPEDCRWQGYKLTPSPGISFEAMNYASGRGP
jgi:hypothetical protein